MRETTLGIMAKANNHTTKEGKGKCSSTINKGGNAAPKIR